MGHYDDCWEAQQERERNEPRYCQFCGGKFANGVRGHDDKECILELSDQLRLLKERLARLEGM